MPCHHFSCGYVVQKPGNFHPLAVVTFCFVHFSGGPPSVPFMSLSLFCSQKPEVFKGLWLSSFFVNLVEMGALFLRVSQTTFYTQFWNTQLS